MSSLPNRSKPDSICQAFLQDPDIGEDFEGKLLTKKIIDEANKVSLQNIFKSFGLRIDEFNRKIICPLLLHKGGREKTPSFIWYPDTNSFYCFGCKSSGGPVNFLSSFKEISKRDAASLILESFSSDFLNEFKVSDFIEKEKLLFEFSSIIKKFLSYHEDDKDFIFSEKICSIFDSMNEKHNLSNEALRSLIDKLNNIIRNYK